MNELQQAARTILAGAPANLPPLSAEDQALLDAPFDPIAWRVEQCTGVLARRIPAKFTNATIDRPEIADWVTRFVACPADTPSLILLGLLGTGKTRATYAAIRAAALAVAGSGRTLTWRFSTHVKLAADLLPKPDGAHLDLIDRYKTTDLLIIDDLTAARISDWGGEALLDIVDTRWADNKPMIITANVAPGDLDAAVGDRIASRLQDSVRVAFVGPDRRAGGAR